MNQNESDNIVEQLNYNADRWMEYIITFGAQENFDWVLNNLMEQLWKIYKVLNHKPHYFPPYLNKD